MKVTRTSKAWMQEHLSDEFVKRAQKEGYRARAAYKLIEIDDKDKLIKPGMTIVDLGSTPGSWSQVAVQRLKAKDSQEINGKVIALDILDMTPIAGVTFIQGDFRDEAVLKQLQAAINNKPVDLVIADMAPNISGVKDVDQAGAAYLTELALEFSKDWLKPNGNFLVKVFIGAGFDEIVKTMRLHFSKVVTRKPKASRDRSSEVYLLGIGRK
ncbi:MAG: 23S rRNA methyltransferase [Bdellovibrio sp.]|nr:23S rRNA methyltransferase [Methylotenera sp.]